MTAGSWLQRALALFLCVAALEAVQAAPQDTKRTITGTVVDQNNLPVVGATVMISNSANGTATDSNGQFTLSGVTDNDELQISFLGYKTVTMQVGTRTAIAATLEEDSGYLDEVVVVGYGTTTRRHIISAVSTVKSEAIENRPVANIQQALQGAAANLIIQTKNFNPTDNQMNISIRGVNTMGNNTPLVVIDGVPQPDAGRMNDLNPNDIESINILKDAGSAAIYGARSSNGVILITTKNGRKEMAPQIRFSAKVGIENPDILYKAVPTYRNAILRNEALSNVGREPLFTAAEIQDFYNHGDCEAAVEQAMQNALQQNYNVSVTGGTKTTTYMLSASYFDQESNYVGPDYGVKRYNLRFEPDDRIRPAETGRQTSVSPVRRSIPRRMPTKASSSPTSSVSRTTTSTATRRTESSSATTISTAAIPYRRWPALWAVASTKTTTNTSPVPLRPISRSSKA